MHRSGWSIASRTGALTRIDTRGETMTRLAGPRRHLAARLSIVCIAIGLIADGGERLRAHPAGLAAAAAQTAPDSATRYELVAEHSDKCLSVWLTQELGAGAVQWTCVDQNNQEWTLEPAGNGSYYLRIGHSGQCLSVHRVQDVGARALQWTCAGMDNQQWALEPAGNGSHYLRAGHSGQCLSIHLTNADGADALQWTCVNAVNQRWRLRPASSTGGDGDDPLTADIVRFLEQATWGPTPQLIEHVREIGVDAFLEEQFNAPMSSYPTLPAMPTTRDTATCPNGSTCQRDNYTMYPLQKQFFRNALYGEDQLRQRVAFALHQIIVVSGVDVNLPFWMAPYLQILDRQAFGNYRDLLHDITLNPAMGNYLDVTGNTRTRPNENYAREILQLFSMGTFKLNPDGTQQLDSSGQPIATYGQEEVNNFARVFTGWVRASNAGLPAGAANYLDPMVPNENNHDTGIKTLLNGVVLPGGQNTRTDTSAAIDNIVADPSTAPYISKLLIQHLVTSNPSPAYVGRVASVFAGEGSGVRGDMKAVLRAILLDPDARGARKLETSYGRLRHPAQLLANMLRAFNARSRDLGTESDGVLNPQSVTMGMDVFRPPSVFSYFSPFNGVPGGGGLRGPEFGLLSTSTSLARANVINTIVFTGINTSANAPNGTALDLAPLQALADDPAALVDALDRLLLHGTMSSEMRASIVGAVTAVAASNTLKRARTAVYLVLTSSQYQVQR
jgi:uncharacterized protein (DUF1800 family)